MFTTVIILMTSSGCKKDKNSTPETNTASYTLKVKDVIGVTGTVTFVGTSTTTTINIVLTGAPSGTHPADLCSGSVVEGGGILLALNPVDATGKSTTTVTTMTYNQLVGLDGYIKILKSTAEPNVILAQGDIGGNVLTATSKTYSLSTVNSSGVTGTALFERRANGNTLVTLSLTGAVPGQYPATINVGSITTTGPVTAILSDVDGTTGKSYTNIRSLEDGTAYTYDQWMVYTGYINIYQTSVGPANIICHGNIGSN